MFVASSPASSPVNIYSEHRAFGPFGKAAGELSTESGFSELLWLDLAESADPKFRTLRLICNGTLRVAGTQLGFPDDDATSPLIVELVPAPSEMKELDRLCRAGPMETPTKILYHGVDPASLLATLATYFNGTTPLKLTFRRSGGDTVIDMPALEAEFLAGTLSIPTIEAGLNAGRPLGTVSDKNLAAGQYRFGIEVRTSKPFVTVVSAPVPATNYLDPVVLFTMLSKAKLLDGSNAMDPAELPRSWMTNVSHDRVLITFRDEWNGALVAPASNAVIQGDGSTQVVVRGLASEQVGTIVAPSGWSHYQCEIGVPPTRKLTPIPSKLGAVDTLTLTATAPAHLVIGSVRAEDWFQPTDPGFDPNRPGFELPLYTENNVATALIDGFATFAAITRDMRALVDTTPKMTQFPENYVLLADWHLDVSFPLIPGDQSSTVLNMLQNGYLSPHGLIIRVIYFWAFDANVDQGNLIEDIDDFPHMIDTQGDTLGTAMTSFHWKSSVIRNKNGTFAQLGGVDLHQNRLDGPDHLPTNTKYHDVQLRVQGPAAADVTTAFLDRYKLSALGDIITDSITPTTDTPAEQSATHMVQIARTFQSMPAAPFFGQPWSPNGDRQIWATFRQAIKRARRYIYIEDQYMVGPQVRDALIQALAAQPTLEVILVIPENCEDFRFFADQTGYDRARYLFFKDLIQNPRVIALYVPTDKYFVHAKVKIYDDVFAQIGSSNVNNRSLTNDAEIDGFVLDGAIDAGMRPFAHDLRTRLWAEHLGMPRTAASYTKLNDIDRAIKLMRNRPSTARLAAYSVKNPGSGYSLGWSSVDPDGS